MEKIGYLCIINLKRTKIMKYLIVTEEGDFISTSLNVKKHLANSKGNAVMCYDKYGYWIRYAKRVNGVIKKINPFCDGIARQWAIDFIKNHQVGDRTEDAEKEYYSNNL